MEPRNIPPSRYVTFRKVPPRHRGIQEVRLRVREVGPATRLTITVESPPTTHELPVAKLQSWLDTNGKTPREQAVKVTLRQLLARG